MAYISGLDISEVKIESAVLLTKGLTRKLLSLTLGTDLPKHVRVVMVMISWI
jgi:hypothetical protein